MPKSPLTGPRGASGQGGSFGERNEYIDEPVKGLYFQNDLQIVLVGYDFGDEIKTGTRLEIVTEGEDGKQALEALTALLTSDHWE
jgi:hypothetical protein